MAGSSPNLGFQRQKTAKCRGVTTRPGRTCGDNPCERDARRALGACHGKTVRCDRRRGEECDPTRRFSALMEGIRADDARLAISVAPAQLHPAVAEGKTQNMSVK